jgi:N-acetylglutamate synthase-like GNAT family acetyltransferase
MMIRQFKSADAEPCSRLLHSCLADDSSISPALREKLRRAETPKMMEERAGLFYVAVYESEDQILGVAGLDMNEIRLLCVSPGHRRHGIGRNLFQHFLGMVPGILFPDIFVYSSMQGRDFYRACGFRKKGAVNFDVSGERFPTFFMTFPLR